jgi:cyclohexanone monooxygenase
MRQVQRIGEAHLRRQVIDPELRRVLTPNFTFGCKRTIFSNTFYPSLQQDNVELVPYGVTEVTREGVVAADGIERKVDTIIFGTGFNVMSDASAFGLVHGRDGANLAERWRKSPEAYLGTTCHEFPNAFFMIGPNTGVGSGSALIIIEAQASYIADAIVTAEREKIASLEVRRDVQRAYNEKVQAALSRTVFNTGGCTSHYLDAHGRNRAIYPWTTLDMRRRLRRFDGDCYELQRETPEAAETYSPAPRGALRWVYHRLRPARVVAPEVVPSRETDDAQGEE